MFWLGLLLTICYVPGYTGASVPTQWAVLSIVLPLGLWRVAPYTPLHKLFLIVITYALLSFAWSINLYSAVWGLWMLIIWFLAFHWGTLLDDLRPLWRGLAVGLYASVAIALAQALGYAPVEAADPYGPAGLFFNSTLFGVTLGLILTALANHRLWWYMPPLALGLILSGSRGGIVVLAVGLIARYLNSLAAIATLSIMACVASFSLDLADSQRLQIWGVTLDALSFWGQGIGSFADLYFVRHTKLLLLRPEYAHNDLLQLTFELGIFAFAIAAIPTLALAARRNPEHPVLLAWCVLSTFYFPIYAPLTAFIGFVLAGHACRDWVGIRDNLDRWGQYLIPWIKDEQPITNDPRREALPLVPRATHSES